MRCRTFLIFALVAILFLQATPSVFAGYWETTIDVLVVESETFTGFADFLFGYYRWLWYLALGYSFTDFWNTFQINFEERGVIKNWHIDDVTRSAYFILQEAITDFNYESGVTTYNGYVIDLLIVFVDWLECDMIGFSPPDWKALIIGNDAFGTVPMENVFTHELSHQFYAMHCDDPNCVMWDGGLNCYKVTWVCQRHYDEINANKHRFDRWVETGGGGCPTLFVWDGAEYAEEGILDIHAESDVTVQHEIQNTLALENGFYKLQLRELDNYTSYIDQVKLYAVDNQEKWHLCPLTYAYHNELGKVTWKIKFDDDNRVDLAPTETISLKFLPSIPYSETAHFIFEINGYNYKFP